MLQDLGALLMHLGSVEPGEATRLASLLDAQGFPPPVGLETMMGLGGPGEGAKNNMALPAPQETPGATAASPDLGSLIQGASTPAAQPQQDQMSGGSPLDANPTPETKNAEAQKKKNPWIDAAAQSGMQLAKPNPMPGPVPGVTGGVKAPDHTPINPAILQGIVQLLTHPHAQQTPMGPSLGQLIR